MRDFLKLITFTFFFSVVIFLVNYTFFTEGTEYIEEKYIDPVIEIKNASISLETGFLEEDKKQLGEAEKRKEIERLKEEQLKRDKLEEALRKKSEELNAASKFYFLFIPNFLKKDITEISDNTSIILNNKDFNEKVRDLKVEFYEEKLDVRWRMKKRTIKLYDPKKMWEMETMTVFVHEFAHFVDLYFLQKKVTIDLSNKFYDISWESTKVMKESQSWKDFVSGYAMTNKYEDFAESFIYFVLHNDDFVKKSEASIKLKAKYYFLQTYIFKGNKFLNTDFSFWNEIKSYYRDITKIDINLEKFLQFLEK